MSYTYKDFVAVLEEEIRKLADVCDFLNFDGQLRLSAYRKIREALCFCDSCAEVLQADVLSNLNEEERDAARLAIRAIHRVAKSEGSCGS